MPEPLALNHVNVPAADPETLRSWYVEKLGFSARGRFLWSGGSLLVFTEGRPLPPSIFHLGFRVGNVEALRDWVVLLQARQVEVPPIEGDETYSTVFFHDPEGNRIELFDEPLPAPEP